MQVRVKICGLTSERDLRMAVGYGADAVGFVYGYKSSPRNLSLQELKRLARAVPPYVSTVVVTPASNPELEKLVREVGPTFLQLSGGDTGALEKLRSQIKFESIIQTIHVEKDREFQDLMAECRRFSKFVKAIHLDTKADDGKSLPGGTGMVHDWRLSREIRDALMPLPVVLAGGLTVSNVIRAIRVVRPYAVDVSSGVEVRPGVKDACKMKEFLHNSKRVHVD